MSAITLNIYSKTNKKEIEKTFTAEGYDLELGIVEDFMNIIDIDKISDNAEVLKMVQKGFHQIKPFLKDIFPDLTDEDFKRVRVNDLVRTIIQIGTSIVESMDVLKKGN